MNWEKENLENLQIPLLLEIACFPDGRINVRRGLSDLDEIVPDLADMYRLSDDERSARCDSDGRKVFRNVIQFVRQKLIENGEIAATANEFWAVNAKGMQRLRDSVVKMLNQIPSGKKLAALLTVRDENDQELLLSALRLVPEESLPTILRNCETQLQLFIAAVQNIPAADFEGFAVSAYEEIRDLLIEYHIAPFRGFSIATNPA